MDVPDHFADNVRSLIERFARAPDVALLHGLEVGKQGATPKEKSFIEEVTRVTYERDRAQRLGLPLSEVRPSFAS